MKAVESDSDPADPELLTRVVSRRDEAAFAALVRRHGPMVLRLCRCVLQHEQDAEDAFQATFLVLTRSAASLRPRESLGGWLCSVAYRTAQKARIDAARRRKHEDRAAARQVPDPLDQLTVREAQDALDLELARLPDKFLAPLVLCYLEGLTQDEAAHRLGWPASTLKSRLEQARERLRARLALRGLPAVHPRGAGPLDAEARPGAAAGGAEVRPVGVRDRRPVPAGGPGGGEPVGPALEAHRRGVRAARRPVTRGRVSVATLLRNIFGNPSCTVSADPSWLTSAAVSLARTIYEERTFDRLPVLADALEEAGSGQAVAVSRGKRWITSSPRR